MLYDRAEHSWIRLKNDDDKRNLLLNKLTVGEMRYLLGFYIIVVWAAGLLPDRFNSCIACPYHPHCIQHALAMHNVLPMWNQLLILQVCGWIMYGFTGQQDSNSQRVGSVYFFFRPAAGFTVAAGTFLGSWHLRGIKTGETGRKYLFLRSRAITPEQPFATVSS